MTSETQSDRAGRHNGGSASDAAREASRHTHVGLSHEVDKLIDEIENLMLRMGDAADPEMRRLRGEVETAIADTRKALGDRSGWAQRQVTRAREAATRAKEAFEASDRYVHQQPWQTAGVAAVTGLLIGCLVGMGRR